MGSVILFLHVRIYEAEGEKVFDAVEAVGAVLAIEQDAYGALVRSSISSITWRQAPHGEIGDLRKPFPFLAAMASVRIGWSG